MQASASATRLPNRWLIVVAAVVMQLALGAVYAWSLFVTPLLKLNHITDKTPVTLTFTLSITFLGIGALIGGPLINRLGPRLIATTAGVLYGVGVFLAGFSTTNLTQLYLTYGVIAGLGLGMGYIVPVALVVKWFPDKRGVVTGLAVFGFGGGAALTTLIVQPLLKSNVDPGTIFNIMGVIYFVMVVGAAQFYRTPPAGYVPAGWTPSAKQTAQRATRDFTVGQALSRWQWYALWLMLALNVSAGATLISQANPLAVSAGATADIAAGFVIAVSIFNALGRFFWSSLSDAIGRRMVFMIMFALQVVLFVAITQVTSLGFFVFAPLMLIVALCYGGGFGTMPAFAADYFGAKYSGAIYGPMLTAWSAGSALGPILLAQVQDRFDKQTNPAFLILAGFLLVGFVITLFIRPPRAAAEVEGVGAVQASAASA